LRIATTPKQPGLAYQTPLRALLSRLTSNDAFFVRDHAHAVPHIAPDEYRLEVRGATGTQVLRLADLRAMRRTSLVATLACAGNGRSGFEPVPPGVPWDFGAISTARWDGVRLSDVLARAGAGTSDAYVVFDGYDPAPDAERPPYRRSLPLSRALDDGTILADTMNGEPLPPDHGGPVRLLVAGWTANHSVKWLRRIALAEQPDDGWWMRDYRVAGPGGTLEMIEAAAPMAIIASPQTGATFARDVVLHGVAYGEPAPARVLVDVDGVRAGDAEVRYDDGAFAWGRWSFALTLDSGTHRIAARPLDAYGNAGPARATWNANGYRYDGPHAIEISVSG